MSDEQMSDEQMSKFPALVETIRKKYRQVELRGTSVEERDKQMIRRDNKE